MTSKNGAPELVSMLQYMKEWEAVKMNILEIGKEIGIELGERQSLKKQIQKKLTKGCSLEEIVEMLEIDMNMVQELIAEMEAEEKIATGEGIRDFEIENEMYRRAVELIETRYPIGCGGAGVVHTANGNYYTSVSIETGNVCTELCIETGAMLEAHKFNEKVTHCMCLVRENENAKYQVLSPCGICQERLRYWGEDVQVAVTTEEETLKFVTLKELQPYHWTKAFRDEEIIQWKE